MNVSLSTIPASAEISRGRLATIVLATAAAASAVTALIAAFTVSTGSPVPATPARSPEVQANLNNIPPIPKLSASANPIARLPVAYGADAGWGTGYGTHPALGNPIAQLPIAFGADGGWVTDG